MSAGSVIPKVTHRIWVQGPPPDEYDQWIGSWSEIMPDWDHRLWHEDDYYHLLDGELKTVYDSTPYEGGTHYTQKADIAGKAILYAVGGVMMCADFQCLHHMGTLFDDKSHVVAWWETPGQISNGIIGAPAEHPAVKAAIGALPNAIRVQRQTARSITYGAGPKFIHPVWKDRTDIELRDAAEVYPYLWTDPKPDSYGNAYAVHHWKKNWR